jgi:dTDP-glucose 4,6-dehydratase
MRILVTGAAGFIGSHFARCLVTDQTSITEVIALDSLTYAGNLRNVEDLMGLSNFLFIQDDICNKSLPEDIFLGVDAVVNFAAESHVDRSIESSAAFIQTNIQGTHNLLELTLKHGIPKYLQVSTDEVYGSISEGSWDESFPLLPNSPYAASKASADLLVRSFSKTHGLHTNITRCSNNFGTHQYPEKLIPVIIGKILAGQQIPIYGDGQNCRDWLHVLDHCRGIRSVMTGGASGEVYNIGGGTELSNLDLARKIIHIMDAKEDLISFVADRKGHDFRYSVSSEKIERDLNYKPLENIDESLQDIVDWYIQNPNWWSKS